MNDKEIKESVERLFNTLGTDLFKSLYNREFHFEITDILRDSPMYYPPIMLFVKTDKPIPTTLRNMKEDSWTQGRYVSPDLMSLNLEKLLKYIGLNNAGVVLQDAPLLYNSTNWNLKLNPKDYIENPQRYTQLTDETWVIENETGIVFPLVSGNYIDVDLGTHLQDIEGEEWWESLTDEDKINLDSLYT